MISSAQPVAAHKGMYTPLEELPESTRQLFDYNPEKAKQLLAEAGYPDGFKTKVLCWQSEQVDQLSIFAAYFADIGVDMELDIKEYSVYVSTWRSKNHPALVYRSMGTGSGYFKFNYWRGWRFCARIGFQVIYLEAIFLSIVGAASRQRLWALL